MAAAYLDTSTMGAEVTVRRTWGGVVVIIANTGPSTPMTAASYRDEMIIIEFADARIHRQRQQGEELAARMREAAERVPVPIQPRVFRKPRVPYPEATVPPLARPVLASRFTEAQARRGCRGK